MKKEKNSHLTLEERQRIHQMRVQEKGFREIGRAVGRHGSTIKRELGRNKPSPYMSAQLSFLEKAKYAHDKAKDRRRAKIRKRGSILDRRVDVQARVLALLESTKYSPEKIADIMSQSDLGIKLSGKTIRRWIKKNKPNYQQHFPHRGKRRRQHLTPERKGCRKKESAPNKRSAHEREAEANERLRPGDFELDMVVCSQSTRSILSIRDRKTRLCWLDFVDDLKADTVRQGIIRFLRDIPTGMLKTLTFDRGSEFADVYSLEGRFGLLTYFCDAYCAWQKGSVENQNKEIRRYIPKGTDLSQISYEDLKRVEQLINAKPRPCLRGQSSGDAWILESRMMRHTFH